MIPPEMIGEIKSFLNWSPVMNNVIGHITKLDIKNASFSRLIAPNGESNVYPINHWTTNYHSHKFGQVLKPCNFTSWMEEDFHRIALAELSRNVTFDSRYDDESAKRMALGN